jgi:hypothetical protein
MIAIHIIKIYNCFLLALDKLCGVAKSKRVLLHNFSNAQWKRNKSFAKRDYRVFHNNCGWVSSLKKIC